RFVVTSVETVAFLPLTNPTSHFVTALIAGMPFTDPRAVRAISDAEESRKSELAKLFPPSKLPHLPIEPPWPAIDGFRPIRYAPIRTNPESCENKRKNP